MGGARTGRPEDGRPEDGLGIGDGEMNLIGVRMTAIDRDDELCVRLALFFGRMVELVATLGVEVAFGGETAAVCGEGAALGLDISRWRESPEGQL